MSPMIHVKIVESLALVESGLRRLLEAEADIEVVTHSVCGDQCQQQCVQHQPDVLIMDISTNDIPSLDCIREILLSHPETCIIVLTDYHHDQVLRHALQMGAKGYATKAMSREMMVQSIHDVVEGKLFIDPDIARQMVVDQAIGDQSRTNNLNSREYKIMCLLAEGKSIGEIADTVFLSRNTVANYRTKILNKFGVANNVELTHLAIRYGIVKV